MSQDATGHINQLLSFQDLSWAAGEAMQGDQQIEPTARQFPLRRTILSINPELDPGSCFSNGSVHTGETSRNWQRELIVPERLQGSGDVSEHGVVILSSICGCGRKRGKCFGNCYLTESEELRDAVTDFL